MKTIQAEQIPEELSVRQFVDTLDLSEDVVIEKGGRPCVVLVSPKAIELRQQARTRLFSLIDSIRAQNPTVDADEVLVELELDNTAHATAP
jgi:hypothetical protein